MLNLKKRYYPFSWLIGIIHSFSYIYPNNNAIWYTSQIFLLFGKSHYEGFRLNIFFYAISVFLELCGIRILSVVALCIYIYLTHKLNNYYLPDDGSPVGHLYIKGGLL